MTDIRATLTSLRDMLRRLAVKAYGLAKRFIIWISPPPRLCAAVLLVAFLTSFLWWAVGDRTWDTVFFFPGRDSQRFSGEIRSLPRAWGLEDRAELVAAEYVLGPVDNENFRSTFELGTRVESVIYRSGVLYVDLSAGTAAYADAKGAEYLRTGLEGLRKTLRAGLPRVKRIVVTIGGTEPWADGLATAQEKAKNPSGKAPDGAKNGKKN